MEVRILAWTAAWLAPTLGVRRPVGRTPRLLLQAPSAQQLLRLLRLLELLLLWLLLLVALLSDA